MEKFEAESFHKLKDEIRDLFKAIPLIQGKIRITEDALRKAKDIILLVDQMPNGIASLHELLTELKQVEALAKSEDIGDMFAENPEWLDWKDILEKVEENSVLPTAPNNVPPSENLVSEPLYQLSHDDIIQVDFPKDCYVDDETEKVGVVLHYTAGNPKQGKEVYDWWRKDKQGRVATHFVVNALGKIFQGIPVKKWAYAIYVNAKDNAVSLRYKKRSHQRFLDSRYVQIELSNWGYLTEKDGKYYSYTGVEIPEDEVCVLNKSYRGHKYFQKFTDVQISQLEKLLLYLHFEHGIDVSCSFPLSIFSISEYALKGHGGVWAHTSFRTDKHDIFPQPEIIEMLERVHYYVRK